MEMYVMPMFNKLKVREIEKASEWYQSKLGFFSLFQYKNGTNEVMMEHIRGEKFQDIMLIQSNDFTVGDGQVTNLVVRDIKEIADKIEREQIVVPLGIQPWNAEEMTIMDWDGYLITLTQIDEGKSYSFQTVIKQTQDFFSD